MQKSLPLLVTASSFRPGQTFRPECSTVVCRSHGMLQCGVSGLGSTPDGSTTNRGESPAVTQRAGPQTRTTVPGGRGLVASRLLYQRAEKCRGSDLELAIIEKDDARAVAFPCRRVVGGWEPRRSSTRRLVPPPRHVCERQELLASDALTLASRHSVTAGESCDGSTVADVCNLRGCDAVTPSAQ